MPKGVTGFGTPPVMLGAVWVGVVPPGVIAFGAAAGAVVACENAGALTQVIAKANSANFLISHFPLVFMSAVKRKTDPRDSMFPFGEKFRNRAAKLRNMEGRGKEKPRFRGRPVAGLLDWRECLAIAGAKREDNSNRGQQE
jgi:hypothetical protein